MTIIDMPDNPRAVLGDNVAPDYAKTVTEQMARDYAELVKNIADLLDEARAAPKEIDNDETMTPVIGIIKRIRDADKRAESHREKEKAPYMRSAEAIDSFFFTLRDKLARRVKTGKPGAADILQSRVHIYQERKFEEERVKRQREAEERAEAERKALADAAEAQRIADEAAAAAERARAPAKIEEKSGIAQVAAIEADSRAVDAIMAQDAAASALLATKTKPADLVRTRTDEGMATMAREAYAEVDDFEKLDKTKLWPFIRQDEIEKALRQWAKTTGHKVPMDGARIGFRNKTAIR